jgi:hypothetical protein
MPPPDPPQDHDQSLALANQRVQADYTRFLHTSTLVALVLAPALIALPPRKLDLYTFALGGAFLASAEYQTKARTGMGIMGNASRRFVATEPLMEVQSRGGLLEEKHLPTPLVDAGAQGAPSRVQTLAAEDWKRARLEEEQEKLDRGEGYWSMITDQVWQVWNQEERKVARLKEKDEEVLKEREKGKG